VKWEPVNTPKPPTLRHNALYVSGVILFTPSLQLREQQRQLEEVLRSEVRASGRQHQKRIRSTDIRPGGWQRAYPSLARLSEEDAVFAPGVAEANQLVLLAALRMEGMGYTKSLRIAPTAGS